jgi:hypothetical protein
MINDRQDTANATAPADNRGRQMEETNMQLHTAPEDQGQIVEVSYGWDDGYLYRRTFDQSDRTECWEVADEEEAAGLPEGWTAINGSPAIRVWTACYDPRA